MFDHIIKSTKLGTQIFITPSDLPASNLDSLSLLSLAHNQLSGIIPESICNLSNLDFNYETFHGTPFNINALCPPYPECIENSIGTQDTSECP